MTPKVYINGKFFDKPDAKISVYDHCLLYGDGVFEGIRVYEGKVFKLKEHVDRLFESARAIKLEIPLSKEQMIEAILGTVKINNKQNGYIRPVVTRGAGTLASIRARPPIRRSSSLSTTSACIRRSCTRTAWSWRRWRRSATTPTRSTRASNRAITSTTSSPRWKAIQAGCVEALMLNHKGEVAECSGDNIFIAKRGVLKTPRHRRRHSGRNHPQRDYRTGPGRGDCGARNWR